MPLDEDLHIFMVEGGVLDGPSDVRRTVEEILVFESGEQERHTAGGVGRGHAEKKINKKINKKKIKKNNNNK